MWAKLLCSGPSWSFACFRLNWQGLSLGMNVTVTDACLDACIMRGKGKQKKLFHSHTSVEDELVGNGLGYKVTVISG